MQSCDKWGIVYFLTKFNYLGQNYFSIFHKVKQLESDSLFNVPLSSFFRKRKYFTFSHLFIISLYNKLSTWDHVIPRCMVKAGAVNKCCTGALLDHFIYAITLIKKKYNVLK